MYKCIKQWYDIYWLRKIPIVDSNLSTLEAASYPGLAERVDNLLNGRKSDLCERISNVSSLIDRNKNLLTLLEACYEDEKKNLNTCIQYQERELQMLMSSINK